MVGDEARGTCGAATAARFAAAHPLLSRCPDHRPRTQAMPKLGFYTNAEEALQGASWAGKWAIVTGGNSGATQQGLPGGSAP